MLCEKQPQCQSGDRWVLKVQATHATPNFTVEDQQKKCIDKRDEENITK